VSLKIIIFAGALIN